MRIYRGRIEAAAKEVIERLRQESLVEIRPEEVGEACKDLESVLHEYSRMEREISERSKDIASKQGLDYSHAARLRRSMAQAKNFGIADDALDYIVQQMIEIMLSSVHVEEVFGQDHDLNRVIAPILKKYMSEEEEIDREVRQKLKHLEDVEGTVGWEIEYQRKKEELERLKKLK